MGDLRRPDDVGFDGVLQRALHDLAQQVPLPEADRVLSRPRAMLAARRRERRRRMMAAVAGVAATLILGAVTWQLQSRGPGAGDMAAPDSPVTLALFDQEAEDQMAAKAQPSPEGLQPPEVEQPLVAAGARLRPEPPPPSVMPMREAARRVSFPLHGPGWVPEGVVLVGISVEHPTGDDGVAQVVMRFKGPGSGRLVLRQAGPVADGAALEFMPGHWLDGIDSELAVGLEWVEEGILFQVHGDWDEAAARRFVQSLQPLGFSGEQALPGKIDPIEATPLIGGDSESPAKAGASEPAR